MNDSYRATTGLGGGMQTGGYVQCAPPPPAKLESVTEAQINRLGEILFEMRNMRGAIATRLAPVLIPDGPTAAGQPTSSAPIGTELGGRLEALRCAMEQELEQLKNLNARIVL